MSADSGHVVRNFNALQTAAFFKGAAFDFCQSIGQVYFFQTGTVIKASPPRYVRCSGSLTLSRLPQFLNACPLISVRVSGSVTSLKRAYWKTCFREDLPPFLPDRQREWSPWSYSSDHRYKTVHNILPRTAHRGFWAY